MELRLKKKEIRNVSTHDISVSMITDLLALHNWFNAFSGLDDTAISPYCWLCLVESHSAEMRTDIHTLFTCSKVSSN